MVTLLAVSRHFFKLIHLIIHSSGSNLVAPRLSAIPAQILFRFKVSSTTLLHLEDFWIATALRTNDMALLTSLCGPGGPVSLLAFRVVSALARKQPVADQQQKPHQVVLPPAPGTAYLESERKFNVTNVLRASLARGEIIQGHQFTKAANTTFQDKYYDIGGRFQSHGIWIRRRTEILHLAHVGEWEAKVTVGLASNFTNSSFEEVSGEKDVLHAIKLHIPRFSKFGLQLLGDQEMTAAISTKREVWSSVADANLQIVIDTVAAIPQTSEQGYLPFEHVVGEVEYTKTQQLYDISEVNQSIKEREVARMDALVEHVTRDQELFPTQPKPIGKLSAYFEWKKNFEQEDRLRMLLHMGI